MGIKKDYTEQLDLFNSMSSTTDTLSLDLTDSTDDSSWLDQDIMASSNTVDTITLGSGYGSMTISGGSPVYTIGPITTGVSGPGFNWSNTGAASSAVDINSKQGSGVIDVKGENADIKINGVSLCDTLKVIQDRLNLLQPNPELEAEWAELRELAEQYRKLEQHIRDKQATWDRIKAMPAPEVD
jgi:hypothetical protein